MNRIRESVLARFARDPSVKSAAIVERPAACPSITDGFPVLLLVISVSEARENYTTHYSKDDFRIQERRMDLSTFERIVFRGGDIREVHWLLQGDIVLDKENDLSGLREKYRRFAGESRERKLLGEFAAFLRKYTQGREYLHEGQVLDAYTRVLGALQHWARIVIIEGGKPAESAMWKQVHRMNAGVYKLYEELTQSRETVAQRVELLLLACEFSLLSEMEKCCALLLRIIRERSEAWSVGELQNHPDLRELRNEIPLLMRKLEQRALVKAVPCPRSRHAGWMEICYTR
jgi:hypothetical protein